MTPTAIAEVADYESDSAHLQAEELIASVKADLLHDRLVWPVIPGIALSARKLMSAPDPPCRAKIVHVLSMDPALSTRLLRMPNTGTRDCVSVGLALERLGPMAVELVNELFVAGQVYNVGNRRRIQPHLGRLWRHSTWVASICRQIAMTAQDLEPDVAMLAGLLHDIGKLPALVYAENVPRLLSQRETLSAVMGSVHGQIGNMVLEAWDLPQPLVEAVGLHEDLNRDSCASLDYINVVTAANVLSHRASEHPLATLEVTKTPVFDRLEVTEGDIAAMLRRAKQQEVTFWDN